MVRSSLANQEDDIAYLLTSPDDSSPAIPSLSLPALSLSIVKDDDLPAINSEVFRLSAFIPPALVIPELLTAWQGQAHGLPAHPQWTRLPHTWRRLALPAAAISSVAIYATYKLKSKNEQGYFLSQQNSEEADLPDHESLSRSSEEFFPTQPPSPDEEGKMVPWAPNPERLEDHLQDRYFSVLEQAENIGVQHHDFMNHYIQTLIDVDDLKQQNILKLHLDYALTKYLKDHQTKTSPIHTVSEHLLSTLGKVTSLRSKVFGFPHHLEAATQHLEKKQAEHIHADFYHIFNPLIKADKSILRKASNAPNNERIAIYTKFQHFAGLLFLIKSRLLTFSEKLKISSPLIYGALNRAISHLSEELVDLADDLVFFQESIKYSLQKALYNNIVSSEQLHVTNKMMKDKSYFVNIIFPDAPLDIDTGHSLSWLLDNSFSAFSKHLLVMSETFKNYSLKFHVRNNIVSKYSTAEKRLLISVAQLYRNAPVITNLLWFTTIYQHQHTTMDHQRFFSKAIHYLANQKGATAKDYLSQYMPINSIADAPQLAMTLDITHSMLRLVNYHRKTLPSALATLETSNIQEMMNFANMNMPEEVANNPKSRAIWNTSTQIIKLAALLGYYGFSNLDNPSGNIYENGKQLEEPILEHYTKYYLIKHGSQNLSTKETMDQLAVKLYFTNYKDSYKDLDPTYINRVVEAYPYYLKLKKNLIIIQDLLNIH
ncbi:MAG: hypothetical protein OXC44_01805 [Proteobacteria bacterium]|nr:hypothetical protein [Pseudomonadota bacterium]